MPLLAAGQLWRHLPPNNASRVLGYYLRPDTLTPSLWRIPGTMVRNAVCTLAACADYTGILSGSGATTGRETARVRQPGKRRHPADPVMPVGIHRRGAGGIVAEPCRRAFPKRHGIPAAWRRERRTGPVGKTGPGLTIQLNRPYRHYCRSQPSGRQASPSASSTDAWPSTAGGSWAGSASPATAGWRRRTWDGTTTAGGGNPFPTLLPTTTT